MTTSAVSTKPKAFLDGFCARILAAVCLVAAVALIVHLNRAELFSGQSEQEISGMYPAYISCRDAEYDKLAKWAKNNPEKWTAEVLIRARQSANAMCIRKTASQSGAK